MERKWDMKFMQDYNFKVSGNKTNTIQFSIDVLNIGFLNSDWGSSSSYKCAANWCFCRPYNKGSNTFNGTQTKTFNYDASLLSRWQAQWTEIYILVYSKFQKKLL
jgi:hypothetical protein